MADFDKDEFSPKSLGAFRDESERRLYEALRRNPNLDYDPDVDEVTEEQYLAMKERRRRIAERREAGRAKRAAEQAARTAKEAERTGRKIPAATKPVVKKDRPEPAKTTRSAGKQSSAKAAAQKRADRIGRRVFYICLAVYATVLIVLGFIFLRYTDKCLRRYEASRYENAIDGKMKEFTKMVEDGTVLDMVELPEHACVFESEDLYRSTYLSNLRASGTFSCEKDKKSYDTSKPVFDIYSESGDLVAKMRLARTNVKTIYAILTVSDWKIDSITPVLNMTTNAYRISVPNSYKVLVNGIPVTEEFLTGEPETVKTELSKNVLSYVELPTILTYEIAGLAEEPQIEILDASGSAAEFTPDASGNIRIEATVGVTPETMPQDRHDYALETIQMWADFVTKDLSGSNYGLDKIRKRLIKDSFYYNEAAHYATDVDITFISDHRFDTPKYSNISVTDYTEYSDICYSCHIQFTRNLILNKTGGKRYDKIDGIYFFVYIDDSDDNVINPHWCVAEMIANTGTTGN